MRKRVSESIASGGIVFQSADISFVSEIRWLRAGFFSFAYRLAHLRLSRGVITPMLATIFFLV